MTFHALVVDDDPEIREDVQDRLDSLGHTCDMAESQEAANWAAKTIVGTQHNGLFDRLAHVTANRQRRAIDFEGQKTPQHERSIGLNTVMASPPIPPDASWPPPD